MKNRFKRYLCFFIIGVGLCTLSGCAAVAVGAAAGVGGYALSKDSTKGMIDAEYTKTFDAATMVVGRMGDVTLKDKVSGIIEADVEKAKVKIEIEKVTPKTVQVSVKVRKYLLPDQDLAQKILNKIIIEVS